MAGNIVVRDDGTSYEQLVWEMVNGKWFAFSADGYAMSGFVADPELCGLLCVDFNNGLVTGWQQIDGLWYYFNPISDGRLGIMLVVTWIDGWYVDQNGEAKKE